jgi:xanthine dehydrogenase molybdopterin binding subunit
MYVDDIPVNDQLLVGRVVYSPHAHARIVSCDLAEAKTLPGVHAVLCHTDIPGYNQMGPVVKDEPCLAAHEVACVGQAVCLIAAETEELCLEAEKRLRVTYEPLEPVLDIETAVSRNSLLGPPRTITRGDVDAALRSAPHVITGALHTGAQEHWYLESQVCLCIPGEGNEITVFSSTQHPSETQALIAELLGIGTHEVVVEVRRLGGAFGGKETQANHTACWAALLCHATRRPVKLRLCRDDDMRITGKRHRFLAKYDVGFDHDGTLVAAKFELNSDGGCATDLSLAIMERAMLHVDNAYYVPHLSVSGRVWKTNLPSNTAFRGFGGPQGMAVMEAVIDRIARCLKKDALEIRRRNFYGTEARNMTHYNQQVEHNRLGMLYEQLVASSEYFARRRAVDAFNTSHEFVKRGLAMTPVKFGIAFTTTFLNQAGALVNVYRDGTILVNHGGTEMGQGLHTKMQQVAAAEFGVSLERVKVNATNTSKVPNTSPTAASAGADLNGMAIKNAIAALKARIAAAVAQMFTEQQPTAPSQPTAIVFEDDWIIDAQHADRRMPFAEAMPLMPLRQVSLSATGYYKVPGIGWDKEQGVGKPFHYYAFGMAVTEVEVDILTGRHTVLRTDILHDVGASLNPAIDLGQVEGGYVQGLGWVTTEEVQWDDKGHLLTHSPDTYKIPSVQDIPQDFRAALLQGIPNPYAIRQSKAVAEPPLMLALSAWLAIKDAISAVADHEIEPEFSLPATHEVIVLAAERLRRLQHG